VGTIGFAYNFAELLAHQDDSVWIELTELLALVSKTFMLRRHNWARWLALVWMAFHVAISFPVYRQMPIHLAIFAGIAWVLFSPDTLAVFSDPETGPIDKADGFVTVDTQSEISAHRPSERRREGASLCNRQFTSGFSPVEQSDTVGSWRGLQTSAANG